MARILFLVLLVVLGLLGADAQAHVSGTSHASREEAWTHCVSHIGTLGAPYTDPGRTAPKCEQYGTTKGYQILWDTNTSPTATTWGGTSIMFNWGVPECPTGTTWNDAAKQCAPDSCATAPTLGSLASRGGANGCNAGCQYQQAPAGTQDKNPADVCMGSGASKYCGASTWTPTGLACASGDVPLFPHDPNKDTCGTIPGSSYQECVKKDGTHCVTAPSGKSICWKPGETGPRTTNDGKDGGDRQVAPGIPTAPPNMTNPTPGPSTNTTINNTNYNTNVFTGTGTTPGQGPGTGVDGDGDGDGEEDGKDEGKLAGGAGCDAPPVCEGNAIECYHAQEAWRLRCEAVNDPATADISNLLAGYEEEEAADLAGFLGSDGQGDLDSHREVKEIDLGELDDSGFLGGGGTCPSFAPVMVKGSSLGIDMSKFCELLANVGQIVMALAYLVAIRIIAGGGR